MVKLDKRITDDIEKHSKVKRELIDFEAELAKHKQEAKQLTNLQNETFDFNRAKELNVLNNTVQQAEQALHKRKVDTDGILNKTLNLQGQIKKAIEKELLEDEELLTLEKSVADDIENILKNITEYRLLLRFKRDKHIDDVAKTSKENITNLLQSSKRISDTTPFSNNRLEKDLESYKTSLKEELTDR